MQSSRRIFSSLLEQRAHVLGVRVFCPFVVTDEQGKQIEFAGFLPAFGSPQGLLVDLIVEPMFEPSQQHERAAKFAGIPVSFVNPECWTEDESEFKDALIDWGYFGPEGEYPTALRDRKMELE